MIRRDLSDAELSDLARQALGGGEEQIERLFLALLPRVRNLVRYLVRTDRDVDDLSQEALITLLRGLGSYRGDGEFRAWADRVVARSVFAALKRRPEQTTDTETAAPPDFTHDSVAFAQDAYCARRQLVEQLDTLPDSQRTALVSHHVLGMTVPEVSEELGVPEETVRSRLRHGRERLRRLLAETPEKMVG